MKIQTYRARYAAERYARQIAARFPSHSAAVVPAFDFRWGVQVMTPDGRVAMAGKRPGRYGLAQGIKRAADSIRDDIR